MSIYIFFLLYSLNYFLRGAFRSVNDGDCLHADSCRTKEEKKSAHNEQTGRGANDDDDEPKRKKIAWNYA